MGVMGHTPTQAPVSNIQYKMSEVEAGLFMHQHCQQLVVMVFKSYCAFELVETTVCTDGSGVPTPTD